jgi:uncharacterized protein YjbI with pentapeptide repeats
LGLPALGPPPRATPTHVTRHPTPPDTQDLRRSNFTSADIRKANFKGSNLQGAYLMKAVAFKTNFEDANLSDVLMDRAVMNEVSVGNMFQRGNMLMR